MPHLSYLCTKLSTVLISIFSLRYTSNPLKAGAREQNGKLRTELESIERSQCLTVAQIPSSAEEMKPVVNWS